MAAAADRQAPPRGPFRRIAAVVAAAWRRHEHERAAREAERCLRDAPIGILSDIGIRTDDIGDAVRHGRRRFGGH